MPDIDIKTFVPAELKKKYQRLCLEEDIKMSADLRAYIERRCNGTANINQAAELLKFLSTLQKPTDAEIIETAESLGVDSKELMQIVECLTVNKVLSSGRD
jgi:hypothetical protein